MVDSGPDQYRNLTMNLEPTKALNYIIKEAPNYAKAKADRRYLEEYRKTLKGKLYNSAPDGLSQGDRIEWAYAHKDYEELLNGLKAAIEIEEELKWRMTAAEHKIEVWRSQEASNRFIDKGLT